MKGDNQKTSHKKKQKKPSQILCYSSNTFFAKYNVFAEPKGKLKIKNNETAKPSKSKIIKTKG